ncbi:MAG: ABC transporter permease subunit [Pseudomonadota bacterium]
MHQIIPVFKRELYGYFASPVAYVFIVTFLMASGLSTFYLGRFFESGQASLAPFFAFHPWLYLFLLPALAMRLWAEELKSGTMELLLTLSAPTSAAVIGKFLAAWGFAGLALVLTAPIWITVNLLGAPDNGAILAGYIGSFLMAGGYIAISACLSATTSSQVTAFVLSVAVCFMFTLAGLPIVADGFEAFASPALADLLASFSFLTQFDAMQRGVIEARALFFFTSLIAAWLAVNVILIETRKGGRI